MKERILIALISTLLIYCAGSLAVIFYLVYTRGVCYIEPSRAWLLAELSLSSFYALIGLGSFAYMMRGFIKYIRRVRHGR